MRLKKNEINARNVMVGMYVFIGVAFVGVGIAGMFDTRIFETIKYILLFGSLAIVGLVVARCREARSDEMFDYNYMKAQAITTRVMHYVYCVLMIVSAVIVALLMKANADVNWPVAISSGFFVLMGIQHLVIGIAFWRLETE